MGSTLLMLGGGLLLLLWGRGGRGGGVTSKEGLIVPRFQGHLKENSDRDSLCSTAEGTLGHESQPTLALPIGRVEVMSSLLEAHLVDGSLRDPPPSCFSVTK